MKTMSVVIPTLNEGDQIDRVLDHALAPSTVDRNQVFVVDGGSTDDTLERAAARARVIQSKPGRAAQMNAGAQRSEGAWLLFCHGDTLLPPTYPQAIRQALAEPAVIGGGFTPRYRPSHVGLKLVERILSISSWRLMFGDCALFFRRQAFEAVGGYPNVPLMEEVELLESLRSHGRIVRLPEKVTTSSRRFMEYGVLRQLVLDIWLLVGYHLLGRSPQELAPDYWQTERDQPRSGA